MSRLQHLTMVVPDEARQSKNPFYIGVFGFNTEKKQLNKNKKNSNNEKEIWDIS